MHNPQSEQYLIRFYEHVYVTHEANPDDRWERDSTGMDCGITAIYRPDSSVTGMDIQRVTSTEYGADDIPVGKPAHVVWVKYQTGDTFGSSETWTVAAIKSDPFEAVKMKELCEGTQADERYRPWDGYFEHLLDCRIETLLVGP